MNKKIQKITIVILTGFFFILDRYLKNFFYIEPNFKKEIITNFFSFSFFKNNGIAFGIKIPLSFIITITIVILFFLIYLFLKKNKLKNNFYLLSFCFIFFGAISNLLDRIFLNFTIDYLHLYTSVINIADVMIVTGILLFFLLETKIRKKEKSIV